MGMYLLSKISFNHIIVDAEQEINVSLFLFKIYVSASNKALTGDICIFYKVFSTFSIYLAGFSRFLS